MESDTSQFGSNSSGEKQLLMTNDELKLAVKGETEPIIGGGAGLRTLNTRESLSTGLRRTSPDSIVMD